MSSLTEITLQLIYKKLEEILAAIKKSLPLRVKSGSHERKITEEDLGHVQKLARGRDSFSTFFPEEFFRPAARGSEHLKIRQLVVGDSELFQVNSNLSAVARSLFSPESKDPIFKGETEIKNLEDLAENLDFFTEKDAVYLALWLNTLGDPLTAFKILLRPESYRETILQRYQTLKRFRGLSPPRPGLN